MKISDEEAGFTLPEVLIVTLVTGFMVTLIMFFTFSYWRYTYLLESDQDTLSSRLNAGDILRELMGTSSGLINQNSLVDVNRHNPDPADATGQYWLVIHAVPENKSAASGATTPVVYFKRFSSNSTGAFIMNGTQPYEDEYVLFIDGTKKQLMLRSLANASASGNRLKTSCPPSIATVSCPADRVIATDIASIDMRYFSGTGNTVDWTSIVDPVTGENIGPDYSSVDVVELKLNLRKKPIFQKTNATINSTTIRVALRNT